MIPSKKLGILGGMGPYASCDWYKKILDISQHKYNLSQDYEYPEVDIVSVQMSGWSERGIEDLDLAKACLLKGIDKLTKLRVDYIVIACNTVHYYYDILQQRTIVPIVNLIDFCCSVIPRDKKTAILSSYTTNMYNLYSVGLSRNGIVEVKSNNVSQSDINMAILLCQRGELDRAREILIRNISILKSEGAETIVLGCTELPTAISQKDCDLLLVDPGYVLLTHITDLLYENVPSVNLL